MYTVTKWSFVRDANQKTAMHRVTISNANYDILWIDGIAKSCEIFVRLPRFERTTKDAIFDHVRTDSVTRDWYDITRIKTNGQNKSMELIRT